MNDVFSDDSTERPLQEPLVSSSANINATTYNTLNSGSSAFMVSHLGSAMEAAAAHDAQLEKNHSFLVVSERAEEDEDTSKRSTGSAR